jgi:hypothetical protein
MELKLNMNNCTLVQTNSGLQNRVSHNYKDPGFVGYRNVKICFFLKSKQIQKKYPSKAKFGQMPVSSPVKLQITEHSSCL